MLIKILGLDVTAITTSTDSESEDLQKILLYFDYKWNNGDKIIKHINERVFYINNSCMEFRIYKDTTLALDSEIDFDVFKNKLINELLDNILFFPCNTGEESSSIQKFLFKNKYTWNMGSKRIDPKTNNLISFYEKKIFFHAGSRFTKGSIVITYDIFKILNKTKNSMKKNIVITLEEARNLYKNSGEDVKNLLLTTFKKEELCEEEIIIKDDLYYGILTNRSGSKGFITREDFNRGKYITKCRNGLTNGNGYDVLDDLNLIGLITKLQNLDFKIKVFATSKELFMWLAED